MRNLDALPHDATVAITRATGALRTDIDRTIQTLGGLEALFAPGDRILIKPNINSPLESPAGVDIAFLASFIDYLRESGYHRIAVAESSGRTWAPTDDVVRRKGLLPHLVDRDVPFFALDDMAWRKVQTGGDALPEVHIPRLLEEFDRLIFLPSLKTHGNTGYTLTIKLAMGLTPLSDRGKFHAAGVAHAIADLARILVPDFAFIDGRRAFIDGGPDYGTTAEPGVFLASTHPIALDIEAVRILLQYGAGPHIGATDPRSTGTMMALSDSLPDRITVHWACD